MSVVSIEQQFKDRTVLLTGATGYVGGLVLEALLHTEASRVYVLLRPRGSSSPAKRLAQLLQTNVFHKVRDNSQLLAKVVAVEGDITFPGLGLQPAVTEQVQSEVHFIIHTAADIRLEVGIHSALTANYLGTSSLLQLAQGCAHLLALVHTSSCFVNMNLPRSSIVESRIYPLTLGNRTFSCEEIVQDLLSLPPAAADVRACALGQRWGFPNNYTLSKHLAEQLVQRYHQQQGLPAAIVRPSLVCACLYEPLPGHVGNWAGPIGASAALALGFYQSLRCVSSQPLNVWDVMPADLVVSAILAAAAAVAAGEASSIAAARSNASSSADSCNATGSSNNSNSGNGMLIVQSSSTSTYPMTLMEGWNAALEFIAAHPPKFRLSRGLPGEMTPAFQPNPAVVKRERTWTALKVWLACTLLRLLGMKRAAARLKSGFEALCVYGTGKTDKDLVFSADTLEALEQRLPPAEQQKHPLVMRPGMHLPCVSSSSSSSSSALASSSHPSETSAMLSTAAQSPGGGGLAQGNMGLTQQHVLTWRRYFHTQMAAVYSALFKKSVPRVAPGHGTDAAPVEHDFVFVR